MDANALLEEVARFTFEALLDSANHVPAVSSATGVKISSDMTLALGDFAKIVSAYHKAGGPQSVMTPDSFAAVDADGAKVRALTASAMASLVRSANTAALNNEALTNTLTTIAATTGCKVTARAR